MATPRDRLAAIISLAVNKKDEIEPASVVKTRQAWRWTGMLGGAAIGANTALDRGAAQAKARAVMQGSEVANKYHDEDVAHELKKAQVRGTEPPAWTQPQSRAGLAAARVDQLENGPIGHLRERSALLRGSRGPIIDITPEVAHAAPAAEAAVKAAPKTPFRTRMKYAAEDAMHGTKKFLTRHSVGRNAAIGGLLGIAAGNYIGGVAGRELHRSQQANAKKAAETRRMKQVTEIAKTHAMAKAIMENMKRNNQLSAREELDRIINFKSQEEPDNNLLRNATMLAGIGAIGTIGYKGGRLMDSIRKSYRSGAKEIVNRAAPAAETVREAADNIKNATAWSSDIGRLWGAFGGPRAVGLVTQGAKHVKSVPAHFRQGLANEGSANTLGGRIGRRIGRAWKSVRDSFNSAPAGMPVRMSARQSLDSIIQMSMEEPTERTKRASRSNWSIPKPKPGVRYLDTKAGSEAGKKMLEAAKKITGTRLSARDQLDLILLGVDANGKLHNSKGEFGGDNDAVAHPTAMRMTYGKALGIAATTGTAGGIAGVSAKALLEKLKSIKRK